MAAKAICAERMRGNKETRAEKILSSGRVMALVRVESKCEELSVSKRYAPLCGPQREVSPLCYGTEADLLDSPSAACQLIDAAIMFSVAG